MIIHYFRPFLSLFPTEILLQAQHHDAKWSHRSQWVQTSMPKPTAYAWAHLHLLVKWGDHCLHGLKTACLHSWLGSGRPEEDWNWVFKPTRWNSLSSTLWMALLGQELIVHAPSKKYQFTYFQKQEWTINKMKTELCNFFHYLCGNQSTFSIYSECIIHVNVVLKYACWPKITYAQT